MQDSFTNLITLFQLLIQIVSLIIQQEDQLKMIQSQKQNEEINIKDDVNDNQEIQNNSHINKQDYKYLQAVLPKSSLCRFYLRGNCPSSKQQCQFAHGISDLKFSKYDPQREKGMKQIYLNFRAEHSFNQLNMSVSQQNKNYLNLFDFQCEMAGFHTQQQKNKLNKLQTTQNKQILGNGNKIMQAQDPIQTKEMQYKEGHEQKQKKVYFEKRSPSPIPAKKQNKSLIHTRNQYEHTYQKKQNSIIKEEYDPKKAYTLQQINMNRTLKIQIRKQFHKHQFFLFLKLIQQQYGDKGLQNQNQDSKFGFKYDILQLQYYRVGFNKLMTRIKISFLIDYLQQEYKGGFFKFSCIQIPYARKIVTYYLKLASQQQIIVHYKKIYKQVTEQFKIKNKPIRQEDVKQAMMTYPRNWWRIPPIIQVLRFKHCTFRDFIVMYILKISSVNAQKDEEQFRLDWITDQSLLLAQINKIIEQEILKKQYCIVSNDILAKNSKFSKALVQQCVTRQTNQLECPINEIDGKYRQSLADKKQQQSIDKLRLIRCPNIRTQIITKQSYLKPQAKYHHQFGITLDILIQEIVQFAINKLNLQNISKPQANHQTDRQQTIKNNNYSHPQKSLIKKEQVQKKENIKNIFKNVLQQVENQTADKLSDYTIIEISNSQQLLENSQTLLTASSILGVDLQGSLVDPENGYLSLIQINHYSIKTIYLIDYWILSKNQTVQKLQKCKHLLTKILNNNQIVKVIHDSRNDSQSLYNLLKQQKKPSKLLAPSTQTCQNNMTHKQEYQNKSQNLIIKFTNIFDTAASEQIIRQIQNNQNYNSNTPGLNQVLQKYGQMPNKFKQKFHKIWAQKSGDPSIQRPMSQQFKQYCSMDVLGLPKVYIAMSKKVNPYFLVFISQLHADFSQARDSKRKAIQKFNNFDCNKQQIKDDHFHQQRKQKNRDKSSSKKKDK